MSPDIRWRNGGPLLLPGGVVGGSENCCCDNPPPPACGCPDLCIINLDMTSPTTLKSSGLCNASSQQRHPGPGDTQYTYQKNSAALPCCEPWGASLYPIGGFTYFPVPLLGVGEFSKASVQVHSGNVEHFGFFRTELADYSFPDPIYAGSLTWVEYYARVDAGISCNTFSDRTPEWFMTVSFYGWIVWKLYTGRILQDPYAFECKRRVTLKSSCFQRASNKYTCTPGNHSDTLSLLSTPINVSVTYDSCEITGHSSGWDSVKAFRAGSSRSWDIAFKQHIENATTTFTIGSRSKCSPAVACNCATSLAGLKVTFDGKEFVMGTESFISESGAYFETWAHDAPGTFRYRKNDLSNTETYVEKEVEVYCQTDNTVSPPVDRWYTAFTNWCKDEANYGTTYKEDYFIGYFECEPASDCSPFSAETPIPAGSPRDVERVDGWPQGSGCTVPGPATITLSQDCG